jgi:hypothetical protein
MSARRSNPTTKITTRCHPIWHYFPMAKSISTSANLEDRSQLSINSSPACGTSPSESIISVHTVQDLPTPPTLLLNNYTLEPSRPTWQPIRLLSVCHSSHPLDINCRSCDLSTLRNLCSLPLSNLFTCLRHQRQEQMTVQHLQDLLSPDSTMNQQVIQLYLHLFCHQFQTSFLDTSFFSQLQQHGWGRVSSCFSNTSRHHRQGRRPSLVGEKVISIPCHVNGCHWVAVTRREVNNKIIFLYANDMNNPSTECLIRQTLSTSNTMFYPPTAQWITCHNSTYYPHLNECRARTLLALSIQALHPDPHQDIVLPYMHENLAQIGRTWIGTSLLLNSDIPIKPLQGLMGSSYQSTYYGLTAVSQPYSIIDWTAPPDPSLPDGSTKSTNNKLPSMQTALHTRPRLIIKVSPVFSVFINSVQPLVLPITNARFTPITDKTSARGPPQPIPPLQKDRLNSNPPQQIRSLPSGLHNGSDGINIQLIKPTQPLPSGPLPKQHTLHKFLLLPELTPDSASNEVETWGHTMDGIDPKKKPSNLLTKFKRHYSKLYGSGFPIRFVQMQLSWDRSDLHLRNKTKLDKGSY